jgi:hypothetical protein
MKSSENGEKFHRENFVKSDFMNSRIQQAINRTVELSEVNQILIMQRTPKDEVEFYRKRLAKSKAMMRKIEAEIEEMKILMVGKYWTHKRKEKREWLHEIWNIFDPQIITEERILAYWVKEDKEFDQHHTGKEQRKKEIEDAM